MKIGRMALMIKGNVARGSGRQGIFYTSLSEKKRVGSSGDFGDGTFCKDLGHGPAVFFTDKVIA